MSVVMPSGVGGAAGVGGPPSARPPRCPGGFRSSLQQAATQAKSATSVLNKFGGVIAGRPSSDAPSAAASDAVRRAATKAQHVTAFLAECTPADAVLDDPWRPSERLTWGTSAMLQMGLQFAVPELQFDDVDGGPGAAPSGGSGAHARLERLKLQIQEKERRHVLKKEWLTKHSEREVNGLRVAMWQTIIALANVPFWKHYEVHKVRPGVPRCPRGFRADGA